MIFERNSPGSSLNQHLKDLHSVTILANIFEIYVFYSEHDIQLATLLLVRFSTSAREFSQLKGVSDICPPYLITQLSSSVGGSLLYRMMSKINHRGEK